MQNVTTRRSGKVFLSASGESGNVPRTTVTVVYTEQNRRFVQPFVLAERLRASVAHVDLPPLPSQYLCPATITGNIVTTSLVSFRPAAQTSNKVKATKA